MITLGHKAKDRISGFSGTITGRAQYLTGCDQYLIRPSVGADGAFRGGEWFDENAIEVLDGDPLVLDTSLGNGPDKAAPKR